MIEAFKKLLDKYDKVSVLTHLNPDADTIGTALGIYSMLKNVGKQVEVCTAEGKGAKYLDFLPHFAKIKRQIDFDDSLIISCDSGSIDLLDFDLSSREIVNIDHHKSNTNYGTLNVVDSHCASASQTAYNFFKNDFEITKDIATCFYVALLTDTQNFVTLNVDKNVFDMASELIHLGVSLEEVNRNLIQRKSLSSFRLLSSTLDTLELHEDTQIATMVVNRDMLEKSGATISDTIGLIDYGINLATVKIAILVIEFEKVLKVSFRSSQSDVSTLATVFGGGGHIFAAGFSYKKMNIELLLNEIIIEIKERGLIDEK